jgi:AmmeMemoRadiSam system protein B
MYSAGVAAAAYARLRGADPPPRRIVIAGPAHYVRLRGAAMPLAVAWSTPLGTVRIAEDLRDLAMRLGAVADDAPHAAEHALEVQLPFLQRVVCGDLSILPIAVGEMASAPAADLLGSLRGAADLLIVSTDLSHFHADEVARRLDRQTVEAIQATDADAIGLSAACGIFALRGVVELARQRALSVELLERRTSADAGGDPYRVVGYAAIAIG